MTNGPGPQFEEPAGRWALLASVAINLFLLYWFLRGVEAIFLALGVYIPFEATYLVAILIGAILLPTAVGTTPGGYLCGIEVRARSGGPIGFGRRAYRELVAKPLALVPLLVGIALRVGTENTAIQVTGLLLALVGLAFLFVYSLVGLHDRVAGTATVRGAGWRWPRAGIAAGLALSVALLGGWAASNLLFYFDVQKVFPDTLADVRFAGRDSTLVVDVATVDSTYDAKLATWFDSNAVSPAEFAISKCRQYPLVLFGEGHNVQEILSFMCDALPRLYREAGVQCLGMESINSEDNDALDRLMAGGDVRRGARDRHLSESVVALVGRERIYRRSPHRVAYQSLPRARRTAFPRCGAR